MKHIRMPKELADKWLAALRSGKYEQGEGCLMNEHNEYCCLGVLQHCVSGRVSTGVNGFSESLPGSKWLMSNNITFLTRDGGEDQTPWIEEIGEYIDYANDTGTKFDRIAELIESELEYAE